MTDDCIQYDVGTFVKQHSDAFLKRVNPETGKEQLDYYKATPEAMQVMLDELQELTDEAAAMIYDLHIGFANSETQKLQFQMGHWRDELSGYKAKVRKAVEQGLGPGSIYHCVTAPLLLGWHGNPACTGPNPLQTQQMVAKVGTPLTLLNQALCARQSNEDAAAWVTDYWRRVADGLVGIADDVADSVVKVVHVAGKVSKSFWNTYQVPILAGTALAAIFLLTRK